MMYREYLVMRKAVAWFVGLVLAVIAVGLISNLIQITPGDANSAGIGTDAGWLAAIFGAIFGVALGNGSREAARVLFVLPATRWKLASQIIAVDFAGTTVVYVCMYAIMVGVRLLYGQHFVPGAVSATGIVMALAMTYGTYGWTALLGMLGRRVPYCGLIALPALMLWMILAPSLDAIGPLLRAIIVANPFAVFNAGLALNTWAQHRFTLDSTTSSLQWLGTSWTTPILIAITVATCGLAVSLWQRAEAL